MNALEIAELLDHSALGSLGDFYYVADASKELKRLFVVEAQLVSYKVDHANTLAALLTLMDKASEMEAELAAVRARVPVAWRVYCPAWIEQYGQWNGFRSNDLELEYYKERPDCYIEYAYAEK